MSRRRESWIQPKLPRTKAQILPHVSGHDSVLSPSDGTGGV